MFLIRARFGNRTVLARSSAGAAAAVLVATESSHVCADVLRECLAAGTDPLTAEGPRVPVRALTPLAPVRSPAAVVGVGLNYHDHAREVGAEPGPRPLLFGKTPGALADPDAELVLPSAEVDYEGELAVVIGRETAGVPVRKALGHVLGYTIANDLTARDFQREDTLWFRGKSFRGSCPLGPVLVSAEAVPDLRALTIRTTVDGAVVQHGSVADMIFPVAELVSFTSRYLTLQPGDVLLTGTPSGVGVARRPPLLLTDGGEVTVEIDGIGLLRNRVRVRLPET
ncbi:fumarylacetoacetate hydrolase family protein [Streptomyces sp. TP-A0874]|uniref:fumarylacetoacetate hydrolase family protein n=1 Tax=Streptomyces sp. TP-A0874 TaxID=549819 RepID=UPI000853832B|nr:fumarylacetoacetate hydrolase family protein [Streptomyces sp. TP-A0874]